MRWVGFANLAQTVAERLRRGDDEADDVRASSLPPAATQADARHIHGGECSCVARPEEQTSLAAAQVRVMMRGVATAGGRASTLFEQLRAAEAYLSAPAVARAAKPDSDWRAYQRVVAGDLDRPD